MIDLDKTRTILQEVAQWYYYHRMHKITPSQQFDFYKKTFNNIIIIQARLFSHLDMLYSWDTQKTNEIFMSHRGTQRRTEAHRRTGAPAKAGGQVR